ncbi:hypothetical protein D9758_000868 [Tetrapyrgos nigripes]|uniref:Uncharacterized protein n=1 Tax=Tetrapyrgos nigripes TaxID=182062 RepID=A0A8H5GZD6_9AGAR|nr:hypothetical protein D9758_000868 [Tetrapyrgos nigripes]
MRFTFFTLLAAVAVSSVSAQVWGVGDCGSPPAGSQCARYCIVCCDAFPDSPNCVTDATCMSLCSQNPTASPTTVASSMAV